MRWTVIFAGQRPWQGVALIAGAVLAVVAVVIGVMLLPALLFGTRLEPAAAEAAIRGRMLGEVARRFKGRWAGSAAERAVAHREYAEEIGRVRALQFVSTDVDTSIFGAFRIRQSFVVEAVLRSRDGAVETRYFCFLDAYLTGDCAKWNWYLAW